MILAAIGIVVGAILGWAHAIKRGGNMADKFQYAVVHAIALMLVGYFIALFMAKWGI